MVEDNQLVNRTTSTYVESTDVSMISNDEKARIAPLRIEKRFFNDTGESVIVIDRTGIPFSMASSGRPNSAVRIQVIYEFDSTVELDPTHDFIETPADTEELKTLQHAVKSVKTVKRLGGRTTIICAEYTYPVSLFRQCGNSIYIAELDITLNLGDAKRNMPLHPYSHSDIRKDLVHGDCDVNHRDRFGLSMYIVSNTDAHPGRYINIAGHVYHIPAITNYAMKEGVYFSAKSNKDSANRQGEPDTEFTSISDADVKFRLYKTREEAAEDGRSENKLELELVKAKHDIKVLEQKVREKNIRLDDEQAHIKRINELEEHYRQLQAQQRKDYYDERSTARKDSSEGIKMVPVVLTSLAAIGGLIWKLSR